MKAFDMVETLASLIGRHSTWKIWRGWGGYGHGINTRPAWSIAGTALVPVVLNKSTKHRVLSAWFVERVGRIGDTICFRQPRYRSGSPSESILAGVSIVAPRDRVRRYRFTTTKTASDPDPCTIVRLVVRPHNNAPPPATATLQQVNLGAFRNIGHEETGRITNVESTNVEFYQRRILLLVARCHGRLGVYTPLDDESHARWLLLSESRRVLDSGSGDFGSQHSIDIRDFTRGRMGSTEQNGVVTPSFSRACSILVSYTGVMSRNCNAGVTRDRIT